MIDKQVIKEIRSFNRYYTKLLGLLNNHLLESKYSLVEARVLYEIHAGVQIAASQIALELGIDKGQLSKIIKQLENYGTIARHPSKADGRVTLISLTTKGQKIYAELDTASNLQIGSLISGIKEDERHQLIAHMQAINKILMASGK
jgi:DNA-binding MarR family transcriptional regulator